MVLQLRALVMVVVMVVVVEATVVIVTEAVAEEDSKAIVIIRKEVLAVAVEVTEVKAEVDMVVEVQAVMAHHHKEMDMVDSKEWKQEAWDKKEQEKIQFLSATWERQINKQLPKFSRTTE